MTNMSDPSLASYVTSAIESRRMQPISESLLRDIERELLSVAHRWAAEHAYALDGWACVCFMPPLPGQPDEPVPVRVLRAGMTGPVVEPGMPDLEVGRLTVLLRDPFGILTELDAADWMIRNGWNRGLGWGT